MDVDISVSGECTDLFDSDWVMALLEGNQEETRV